MTMERPPSGSELQGQLVAITGRLASMNRRDLMALIVRRGGAVSDRVTRLTTLLVVGREGWPLEQNGQLSRKLQHARELKFRGQPLQVLSEEQFLRKLSLPHLASEICASYGVGELTRLLGVPRRQIESWARNELLTPVGSQYDIPCYDFRQVTAARSLVQLLNSGVSPRRLKRSVCQLRSCLDFAEGTPELVGRLLSDGARLLYRSDSGHLMEPSGQLLMEFAPVEEVATVQWSNGKNGDGLFEEAVRHEEQGDLHEAVRCYRQLLLDEGPDADVCFNLANALQSLGELSAAIERFHQAVTLDREHIEAWNNLGNLLAETGQLNEAAEAYRHAVSIDPEYADARYGLADVLDQLGLLHEAGGEWRSYLALESEGPYADYARKRLASSRSG